MGPLVLKNLPWNYPRDLPAELTEMDPALIRELADIVEEAEQPSETRRLEITPWFYFVPCAGVRYYSYQENPSPVNGERLIGDR